MRHKLIFVLAALLILCGRKTSEGQNEQKIEGPQAYFDEEIKPALLNQINQALQRIDVEIYLLSDKEVIEALQRASSRKVLVRIILDPHPALNQQIAAQLTSKDGQVKWAGVQKPVVMNRRIALFDAKTVFLSCGDWTPEGFAKNKEASLLISDIELAKKVSAVFESDWKAAFGILPPLEKTKENYIGNKQSKKFHLPTCRFLPSEINRIYFQTKGEATAAGYTPCKVCKP